MRLARRLLPPVRWGASHLATALNRLYWHYVSRSRGPGGFGERELLALGAAADACCRLEDALSVVLGLATWPPEEDSWVAESLSAVLRENGLSPESEIYH